MFTRRHGLETDKGDLHAGQRANRIPRRVCDVEAATEAAHQDQDQSVQRDHVGDEYISTPGSHHVEIEHSCEGSEEGAAELEGFDPAEEGEHEQENSDGLVIVGTSN